MRIEALAILFMFVIASASAAAADPVLQQEPHLPQFVSPAARDDVVQLARESNADETRQAAEVLSAKFSDATPPENSTPSVNIANATETSGTSSDDVRNPPKLQGRVAVLVAETPSKSGSEKKAKISRAKQAAATKKHAPRRMRMADAGNAKTAGHRPSAEAHLIGPQENASALASDEVPGVEAGWQTGIIGLLTNPTFWH